MKYFYAITIVLLSNILLLDAFQTRLRSENYDFDEDDFDDPSPYVPFASSTTSYYPEGSPTTGQAGSVKQRLCCAKAHNLCNYEGDPLSENYDSVIRVAQHSCEAFVGSKEVNAICAYYDNPGYCGTQGGMTATNLVGVISSDPFITIPED